MDETCNHCIHMQQLWQERQMAASLLKFVAITTPILVGLATFIVLVARG